MGVDLKLLVVEKGAPYSFGILDLEKRRELWPKIDGIEKVLGRDVPKGFSHYLAPHGFGEEDETPYGDLVKMVPVSALVQLSSVKEVTDNHKNRAVWAYLRELPLNTMIALWWC